MTLTDRVQSLASGAVDRARDIGLPVESAQSLFSDRIEPLFIRKVSRLVIPFVRRSGVRVLELEPGRVVCEMPLKGNVNHISTMYAGALFTLAEFPGGPLMLGTFGMRRVTPVVTSLDMEFVQAAKTNVRIEMVLSADDAAQIEAEMLEKGKASFTLESELKNTADEVVARSTARYLMWRRRK